MKYSKRAQILSEVVEYINHEDWSHHGNFLVFGNDAFEAYVAEMSGESRVEISEHDETVTSLRDLTGKLKLKKGKREMTQRVSLKAPPQDSSMAEISNWVSRLPKKEQAWMLDVLKKTDLGTSKYSGPHHDLLDALDAALTSAALHNLDESLSRISTFDPISPLKGKFGGPRGAQYFEEAHGCDLAGLSIASAVLCRAMLEAALEETIDPKRKIRQSLKPRESHIGRMIEEAAKLHLDGERTVSAMEIRDAGNAAIHRPLSAITSLG